MNETEFFQHCKQLVGDESDREWDSDSMAGFFQCLRNNREALRSLFNMIPRGELVLERIFDIFDATQKPQSNDGRVDIYCVVRDPRESKPDELLQLANRLLINFREMAIAVDEQELISELTPTPNIRVEQSEPPDIDPNEYTLDSYIFETQCEWHGNLSPFTDYACWMDEAFYYLNCDYYLAHYASWDWYKDTSKIDDPFLPYFEIWRRGADLVCLSADDITLYLPNSISAA